MVMVMVCVKYVPVYLYNESLFIHISMKNLKKYKYVNMYRKTRENLWKNKMLTYKPYGLNTKE